MTFGLYFYPAEAFDTNVKARISGAINTFFPEENCHG